jgi:hypothetical protein
LHGDLDGGWGRRRCAEVIAQFVELTSELGQLGGDRIIFPAERENPEKRPERKNYEHQDEKQNDQWDHGSVVRGRTMQPALPGTQAREGGDPTQAGSIGSLLMCPS